MYASCSPPGGVLGPSAAAPTSLLSSLSPSASAMSRKRSPLVAFADSTPPHSRPPSRAHTKRPRRPTVSDRPSYVHARDAAMRVDARLPASASVSVFVPPAQVRDDVRLDQLMRATGNAFEVLCFVGSGAGVLAQLVEVRGALGSAGAGVWGVVTGAGAGEGVEGVEELGVGVIWDRHAVLTKSLGLLHPLGGGRRALDAIVVLDQESRARIVLPVGWGRRGEDDGGCWGISVVARVVRGVDWLGEERREDAWAERMEVEMA